jgi:RHS repeat-associated protein
MYSPWGEEMHQWNANTYAFTSPYRFNAKELDPETGLAYYGARYYQNKIGVWLSVDPKAMGKSNLNGAPYIFSSNNPIMKFDPDGLDDGWIKNVLTDEYVWHDAATSQSTTPVGFKFVGMSNNDVVRDLGYPTQSVSREHRTLATVPVGDGSSDFGISYFANATLALTARITTSITLNVVNEHSKVSSTNKQGMIIRGLDVNLSGTVSTLNNGNLNGLGTSLSGNAAISVTTSGFSTTQPLRKPQRRYGESIMTEVGSIGVAKVLIPLTTAKLGNSITVKYDGLWSTRGVPVYGPTIFGMLYTPAFSGAFKFNSKNHESE